MKEQPQPPHILSYFKYEHLPEDLQETSRVCYNLAQCMQDVLPEGPEKSAGLRKLLEAKDCFVRSFMATRN